MEVVWKKSVYQSTFSKFDMPCHFCYNRFCHYMIQEYLQLLQIQHKSYHVSKTTSCNAEDYHHHPKYFLSLRIRAACILSNTVLPPFNWFVSISFKLKFSFSSVIFKDFISFNVLNSGSIEIHFICTSFGILHDMLRYFL